MKTGGVFTIFLVLLVPLNLFGLDTATSQLPVDADKLWIIGITQFRQVNLSEENVYLSSSLPLLVKERLTGLKKHSFQKDERLAWQKAIINTELKKQVDNLQTLQKKRDEELFNETKEYQKKKINEDYKKSSAEIKERINFLGELDPLMIIVEDEKEIQIKEEGGRLFAPPPFSALRYASEIGVHVLIWGSIEEIQGYLYLELAVFDRILEKNIFHFQQAGTPEEIFNFVEKEIPSLITALLGRQWASLLVDVDPAFSFIKIDGILTGMGTIEIPYLKPGDITVEIESPGYSGEKKTIRLAHLERNVIEIKLAKKDQDFILINTVPVFADIYLNSLWVGKTPMVLPKPPILTRLMVTLEGFHTVYERIGPMTAQTLFIPLIRSALNFDQLKDAKRSRFYTSMASFLLSVPVPVFSFGLARDYSIANKRGEYEFFVATYYWTFFITGALFVNMIYDLLRYVSMRDKPIG